MFSRILSLALCLVCAPCFAEIIDGTYSTLYLDGGTYTVEEPANINWLRPANGSDVTINGGDFGQFELFSQSMTLYGGRTKSIDTTFFAWEGTDVVFHVADITPESLESLDRMNGTGEGRFIKVRMRLSTGDLFTAKLARPVDGARPQWDVVYAADSMLDVGIDGMIGIGELNNVRNAFGSDATAGDFDLDGDVGILDLNLVRNHFGSAYFPGRNDASAVPEPSTLALLSIAAVLLLQIRHRRPSAR